MANRFPLIVNTTSGNSVQELPSGDFLDLSNSGISNSGNITVSGIISATGNVTGNYILGNGALLTGVSTSVDNINSGTSNVTVVSSGGNVTIGIGGTSNVAVFATAGEYITGVLSASGNVTGGNILTAGLISATGNITTAADITAQNVNSLSDAVLKDNINQLNDARSIINQLFGVEYDWKNGSGHSYGLIAQDVEKVLPNAVKTNDAGLKSVNYNMIIPFLIETIKKLGSEVDELKKKIKP
jgi:hypothetical protein